MLKNIKIIFLSVFFLFGAVFSAPAQSNFKGEVVNIDLKNQIVFSDLTNGYLSVGDIVEVNNGEDFVTYLEVVEAKDSISRLGFVNRKGLATSAADFSKIVIGSQVVKVAQGSRFTNTDALLTQISQSTSSNESLQDQLRHEKVLNQTIEEENTKYKAQINQLTQTITSLQSNLENISKILNDKIQAYE